MKTLKDSEELTDSSWNHVIRCIRLLSRRAQVIYLSILLFQAAISILDLVGLGLIMKILIGLQVENPSEADAFQSASPLLGKISSFDDTDLLLVTVVVVFILKGILSLALHAVNIRIMEKETIALIRRLTQSIFNFRTSSFKKLSSQDISYTIFNSTEIVFRDTLVPVSVITSDFVLLLLISLNLLLSASVLFIPTVVYFLLIFLALRLHEKNKTRNAYKIQWQKEVSGRARVQEGLASLRELNVSSTLPWMIGRIIDLRSQSVKAGAVVTLAQLRPKYFYEMALFGGIGVIALVSKASGNEQLVITYLVLFVISASRMIPSLLRIQYYLGIFQKSKDQTTRIFQVLNNVVPIIDELVNNSTTTSPERNERVFDARIEIKEVSFRYESSSTHLDLHEINLQVSQGESIAIVGPSGSGKSTLIDLILGYQLPETGEITISGVDPGTCFRTWPGKVAYVPQQVPIYEGSLFENIAVGVDEETNSESRIRVIELLKKVELGDFLDQLENGIDEKLSELGSSLSGGQVQRIGIARALFSKPKLLVLDETTSSLDAGTENAIMTYINSLKKDVTIVIVAHRLSTIKTSDRIYYLDKGKIVAQGSFDQVRELVSDFDNQVKLLEM